MRTAGLGSGLEVRSADLVVGGRADESVGKQPEVMAGEAGLWWWRTAGSTAGGGGRRHCWWRRPAALLVEEPLGQRGSTSNF